MDKSKWEYKKLTDVCSILYGYPFDSKCFNDNNQGRPLIRIRDVVRGFTETYTTEKCPDEYIISEGDLLIGMDGEFNISAWKSEPALLNQRVCKIKADDKNIIDGFMYYLMKTKLKEIESETAFVTVKHLSAKVLNKVNVQLPSIADQQRIVAELDCLNEMIALKQEQLKEFDKLAQSIFYDMFGDPVSNDKGWDKSLMGDVCDIIAGGDKPNDISTVKTADYCYPVIANGDGEKGILGYSKNRRVEDDSVTIGARGASIGNCRIVYGGYTPVVRLISLTPQKRLNCIYLYYYANQMHYSSTGAGQAQLTVPNVKKAPIPLPPLELQQQFAEKIQAIEAQKELVKKSIAETQHLLDSRMDYYFD